MNELRQAAEQALKVLEEINEISKPPTGIPLPAEIDNAMETLHQALAQREWVGLTEKERGKAVIKELTAHDRHLERQRIAEEQHIKRTKTHEHISRTS